MVRVLVDWWLGHGEARLSVTGHESGIPTAVVPHLFEQFYQSEHHIAQADLGLGLYISRMLVGANGRRV